MSEPFLPPYPPRPANPLPVLELLRRSRRNLLTMFDEKAFQQQMMSIKVLSRTVFICNSPDTVRHAFVTGNAAFERKSPQMRNALKPLLGDGLFISDGETWRTRRRIVAPIVHGSRVPDFLPLMVEAAQELGDRWADTEQTDVLADMAHLTAEIICRTIFGRTLGHEAAHEIVDGFRDYQRLIGQLDLFSLVGLPEWFPRVQAPAIRHSVKRITSTLDGIIAAYRSRPHDDGASVISMLLDATDEAGAPLGVEALRNEAATIFMAGHETTANCLAWTWYLLSQAPDVEAKLHQELDSVLGGRVPTHTDMRRLVYTRAVIEESLRLYPPVPLLVREAGEPEMLRPPPSAGRFAGDGDPLAAAPPSRLLAHARPLHAGTLHAGCHATRQIRLRALQYRAPRLRRADIRADGGNPVPGHARAIVPVAPGGRHGHRAGLPPDLAARGCGADDDHAPG